MSDWREGKPYRPNVGICLINPEGRVWLGKVESSGPEIVTHDRQWQMPQGGIEEDEDIVEAARRELWEETGVRSAEFLQVTDDWWAYDFPQSYAPSGHRLDIFRGQKQRWVAFRFTGSNDEISISADHTHEPQEFLDWEWSSSSQVIEKTVYFKIDQYSRVLSAFKEFLS